VRIIGDLGLLGKTASADADLLFEGREQTRHDRYRVRGKDVGYYRWATFEGLQSLLSQFFSNLLYGGK